MDSQLIAALITSLLANAVLYRMYRVERKRSKVHMIYAMDNHRKLSKMKGRTDG